MAVALYFRGVERRCDEVLSDAVSCLWLRTMVPEIGSVVGLYLLFECYNETETFNSTDTEIYVPQRQRLPGVRGNTNFWHLVQGQALV